MEDNISEALLTAGSVLLFVIGLSIAILAFSQARETIDTVLSYSDREALTIENDERFYYLANEGDTKRYVGKETIIPTIYRAYKESYKIIFEFPDDYYLFEQNVKNEETGIVESKEITSMDLEQALNDDLASRQFLNGILYHDFAYATGKNQTDYEAKFSVKPNTKSLYQYLTEKETYYKIEESLGTYYTNDVGGTPMVEVIDENGQTVEERQSDVNKTEKRVITYKFIPR